MKKKRSKPLDLKEAIGVLKCFKPRYRVRIPLTCKRGPFLVPAKGCVPEHCKRLKKGVFQYLRKNGMLKLVNRVWTSEHQYEDYRLTVDRHIKRNSKKKLLRRKSDS